MFWLHGQAGSGKSTIAQTIFQQLEDKKPPRVFYTCSKTQAELHNPLNMLPVICFQLCMINRAYGQHIASQLEQVSSITSGLGHIATQLDVFFLTPLQRGLLFDESVVIIIDALDECGSENDQ
ncbi:hypothetical protein BDN72DRAFT_775369, partial [Pluteus cervinus]